MVDNNSTDKSVAIAKTYSFVRVINEKKQGIVYARNAGFNAARTALIGRIDADTRLPKDWVAKVQQFYADPSHAERALAGSCVFYNVRAPRFDHWFTSQFVFRINRLLVGHYILWGANMVIPRKLWLAVRDDTCDANDIHEDLDLAIHLHRKGYQITYTVGLMAEAKMRRVFDDYVALWPNLLFWPRTLHRHQIKTWPLSYLGSVFLFSMSWVPLASEQVARMFGRKPLN